MNQRNRKFLDLARDQQCVMCGAMDGTIVAAHSNLSEHGKTPDLGAARFQELGFGLVIYPSSTLFAAAQSTKDLAATLRAAAPTLAPT